MRFLIVGLLLCLGPAFAQKGDTAADRSMLIALENAWNQAQIHRDGSALTDLLADGFIYTDWDGTVMNKAKFIADIKDPSVQTTLVANDHVEVFFYPGVAIVAGAYHAKGTSQGKPFDHYGRFTDTWIVSKDKWQCVASHTNLIRK
jgi:ketosteroid isomerase-like protein